MKALEDNEIGHIELVLMEFYNVTILPRMSGPASLNVLNGKKTFYAARSHEFPCYFEIHEITRAIGNIIGAQREDPQDWEKNNARKYTKYFSFYTSYTEENKLILRFAYGDY